jgi:hypothetical protein
VILERLSAVVAERQRFRQGEVTSMLANGMLTKSAEAGNDGDDGSQN